jgi:trimeric autotransporter adhesin
MKLRIGCVVVGFLLTILTMAAQTPGSNPSAALVPPPLIQFSSVATDEGGNTLSGVVNITFSLYSSQQGGEPLWTETQNNVPLGATGNYSVQLGITQPNGVPTTLFTTGEAHWLGIQIAGQADQPRVLLVSVPYALKAGDAETIGGFPPSAFVMAEPQSGATAVSTTGSTARLNVSRAPSSDVTTSGGTVNYLPLWDATSDITNSVVFQSGTGTTAKVGIGTTTPTAALSVNGTVSSEAFSIGSNRIASGNYGLGNAFLGFAGNTKTTGNSNTAVGYQALYTNVLGYSNTASGYQALYNTGSGASGYLGYGNTASGYQALYNNNIGYSNTAIGYQALYSNDGFQNTAVGVNALYSNDGGYNTSVGVNSLSGNVNGWYNTSVGYLSGQFINGATSLGYNNTFLGSGAAASTVTLTNATALGSSSAVAQNNSLVLGSINGVNGATASVSVGIGTSTPGATLDVRDNGSGGNTISATTAATEASAVFASNSSTSGSANGGFFNTFSPSGSAVVGINYGTGGSAAYLQGNVNITGTLTKGSGSFKIDHPLDPGNKYLYHSFVESPDMMNVYNGNITTDEQGIAVVALPDYFEALNRDFRYQLTVIGQFAQAIVLKKVVNNQFVIQTDKPSVEVSWQVTGIRQDAYANAHRIPVEVEKPPQEQGRYLHPELFGAPAEQAIGYVAPSALTQIQTAQVSPSDTSHSAGK